MNAEPESRRSRWLGAPVLVPLITGLANFALRLPRLAKPPVLVFDEVFYVPDASDLMRWGIEQGKPKHPPLGKWLIASGMKVFGYTPFGWRIASVVAGSLLAAVIASAAFKLTRRWELGALAGLLVGVDGIVFVTSRVGMLDIFVGLFVSIAAWCGVSAWMAQRDHRLVRRYGLCAALALGLGTATKWSALFCLPVLLLEFVFLDVKARAPGWPRARAIGTTLLVLLVAPLVVYLASFVPTFLTNSDQLSPSNFIAKQQDLIQFHEDLKPKNPYAQSALTWVFQTQPAALFHQHCTPEQARHTVTCPSWHGDSEIRILAVANPAVWAVSLLAGVGLIGIAIWKRALFPALLIALAASQFVPWLFTRPPYSFYESALVPLIVLWVPLALYALPRRVSRGIGAICAAAALGFFVFLYPLYAAEPLSPSAYDARHLVSTWP